MLQERTVQTRFQKSWNSGVQNILKTGKANKLNNWNNKGALLREQLKW